MNMLIANLENPKLSNIYLDFPGWVLFHDKPASLLKFSTMLLTSKLWDHIFSSLDWIQHINQSQGWQGEVMSGFKIISVMTGKHMAYSLSCLWLTKRKWECGFYNYSQVGREWTTNVSKILKLGVIEENFSYKHTYFKCLLNQIASKSINIL